MKAYDWRVHLMPPHRLQNASRGKGDPGILPGNSSWHGNRRARVPPNGDASTILSHHLLAS